MAVLIGVLIIIIVLLTISIIYKEFQIKNIVNQLAEDEPVTISLYGKSMENLGEEINKKIKRLHREKIAIMNREEMIKKSIAHIAHDFRTPLTGILGYLTLLEEGTVEGNEKYIPIIKRKSEDLNRLVKEFYELSILDDYEHHILLKEVDIIEMITDAVISSYIAITSAEISLINKLPSKKILIQGEEDACTRIIQNLLTNAIQYGTDWIALAIWETMDGVVFNIKNKTKDLAGIDIKKIFDRFYRYDTNEFGSGTGLGLYIVKLLVEKIEASINIEILDDNILSVCVCFNKC